MIDLWYTRGVEIAWGYQRNKLASLTDGPLCNQAISTITLENTGGLVMSYKITAENFWDYVEKSDSCWIWLGRTDRDGYGVTYYQGERRAHRISWELHFGLIPKGLHVLHHCDNRPCVKPDHLFLGTQLDNERDKYNKGRGVPGSKNGRSKLTEDMVASIKYALANGENCTDLARVFAVSHAAIWWIQKGVTWRHVTQSRNA